MNVPSSKIKQELTRTMTFIVLLISQNLSKDWTHCSSHFCQIFQKWNVGFQHLKNFVKFFFWWQIKNWKKPSKNFAQNWVHGLNCLITTDWLLFCQTEHTTLATITLDCTCTTYHNNNSKHKPAGQEFPQ